MGRSATRRAGRGVTGLLRKAANSVQFRPARGTTSPSARLQQADAVADVIFDAVHGLESGQGHRPWVIYQFCIITRIVIAFCD